MAHHPVSSTSTSKVSWHPTDYLRVLSKRRWVALPGFLLVFLSTLPVTAPFIVLENPMSAVRASNAVAIVMLFAAGVIYGRVIGRTPWILGLSMVALGAVLVALTMALGG